MRYGLSLPIHGQLADPRIHLELATEAERAGWDGYFVWDHIAWKQGAKHMAVSDPWVILSGIAVKTQKIRIGPMVTPLARRRPWKVARETVALDQLSGGRLILGVGLGAVGKTEFQTFGEEASDVIRGEKLDEALAIVTGLWGAGTYQHAGKHFRISETQFLPAAEQKPRIPIWVAGIWRGERVRKPFRRAAKYEGAFPLVAGREATPQDYAEIRDYVRMHRTSDEPFDLVCSRPVSVKGVGSAAEISAYEECGVTWWMVGSSPGRYRLNELTDLIKAGPARS